MRILIKNAEIVNEGRKCRGHLLTDGEYIRAIGEGDAPEAICREADETIDAGGMLLLPGVIDTHVHFRDPGLTHKGDMATESRAAVRGGVTSIIDMPNTKPATVTIADWEEKMRRAAECCACNYAFFIGATNDNLDELLKADYSKVAGIKLFMGSSTGNMLVDKKDTLNRLFAEAPALIAVHAEDEALIAAGKERALEEYGDAAAVPVGEHPNIRSREACAKTTRTALDLALAHGSRLHVCHLSTAEEADMFRSGSAADKKITAETCPHYLIFDDSDYQRLGSRIKCNPAIKSASDREALILALRDDRIDTIATDHAPHLPQEKEGGALTAASGMPSVQFSLPMMLQLVSEGRLTIEKVVEKMAHNPATIFGIEKRGFLRPGYYADFVLVRTDMPAHTIDDKDVASPCGWTPFIGKTLTNRIERVYVNGTDAEKGKHSLPLAFRILP